MKTLGFFILFLTVLSSVLVIRAFTTFVDKQLESDRSEKSPIVLNDDAAIKRFSGAIQFKTISHDDRSNFDGKVFLEFHQYLENSFSLVSQKMQKEVINEYSIVLKLEGSNSDLMPVLFMGHMDVVPIDELTKDEWLHPPFSGALVDGQVWGRGTLDDKVSVLSLLEAMESFLAAGKQPERSIYFSFGHDEEVGGVDGALKVAEYFQEKGIKFEFVVDEGGAVTNGMLPGFKQPVAIIGIAEKGYVNLKITANSEGGHSSQPPEQTAVGILSQAIVTLEANQFPANLKFTELTFDQVGYYAPFGTKLAMSNLWLLSPIVEASLLSSPKTAASLRTTIAATMLSGSPKSNILPIQASAIVNFRVFPGETVEFVKSHAINIINDDRVNVEVTQGIEPSSVSSIDAMGYQLLAQTIRDQDSNVLVAPYMVQGGTDARYFKSVSDNVYRFIMINITPESLIQIHGINERISAKDYIQAVKFYYRMFDKI